MLFYLIMNFFRIYIRELHSIVYRLRCLESVFCRLHFFSIFRIPHSVFRRLLFRIFELGRCFTLMPPKIDRVDIGLLLRCLPNVRFFIFFGFAVHWKKDRDKTAAGFEPRTLRLVNPRNPSLATALTTRPRRPPWFWTSLDFRHSNFRHLLYFK